VTHLRKKMLDELQLRNYAQNTIRHYVRTVEDFARRFNCSPDRLGPRHVREYQAELFRKGKSPSTVTRHLAALRFFYVETLGRAWSDTKTKKGWIPPRIQGSAHRCHACRGGFQSPRR
jgi:site-specific recombinase XerD